MKFVLANWGTRGEVEPYVTVGRELVRRGHDVHMAVAPEMVGFAEAAGPTAVAYGPDLKAILDPHRDFWTGLFANPWRIQELGRLSARIFGASYPVPGGGQQDADVAGGRGRPAAHRHEFRGRRCQRRGVLRHSVRHAAYLPAASQRPAPAVPAGAVGPLRDEGVRVAGLARTKKVEDAQRRELGLPEATGPWPRRITERGSLEIQAYDEVCYPGLAAEWAKWDGQRPFVGALTMELPTDADDEVASWIAAGTPPICFGFGSVGVESAADTLAMISSACAQLGERALVCAAGSDFSNVPHSEHVKVVGVMNYAAAFPACRAFVHHGGAGTTNAGLRAGLPTLILWTLPDQGLWGARVKRLKVGTGRRFSATTEKSLVADLRTILAPQCLTRARELATRMTKPAESVATAADLVEKFARLKRVG